MKVSARTSPVITIVFDLSSETITFLSVPTELVKLIIEAFPCVLAISEVGQTIGVQMLNFLKCYSQFFKVETSNSCNFTTVD